MYTFSFSGAFLTLSQGGKSVKLQVYDFPYGSLSVDNYVSLGSQMIDDIEGFNFLYRGKGNKYNRFYIYLKGGTIVRNAAGELDQNGLFTFSWTDDAGAHAYQFLCFYCDDDGLVLTDGDRVYIYGEFWMTHRTGALTTNVVNAGALDDLSDAEIEELIQKRQNLFDQLSDAFREADLDVRVDPQTGEIALDSAVLFPLDQAELSPEGKEFLRRFLAIYADVVFGEEYDGFISKVLVEGHTDTQSDYDYNLELSQRRADVVLAYCLSDDNGLSPDATAQLGAVLEAVGRSYDAPIYGDDGQVDMAASRRVAFRFLISVA